MVMLVNAILVYGVHTDSWTYTVIGIRRGVETSYEAILVIRRGMLTSVYM